MRVHSAGLRNTSPRDHIVTFAALITVTTVLRVNPDAILQLKIRVLHDVKIAAVARQGQLHTFVILGYLASIARQALQPIRDEVPVAFEGTRRDGGDNYGGTHCCAEDGDDQHQVAEEQTGHDGRD